MPLQYDDFAITSPGGRAGNEDAHAAFTLGDGRFGWIVADGLGGHGGGDVASRIAVDTLSDYFRESAAASGFGLSGEMLDGALKAAQSAIIAARKQQPQFSRMHSTVVMLVTDGVIARWAHLGDSRLYHFRDGRLSAQTGDHSVPHMLHLAGEITLAQIRTHEDRNRLLRSLGSEGAWKPDISTEPLTLAQSPGHSDAFILCSDGFWEYVLEQEMETDLAASATARDWVTKMERRLLDRVNGGHDNYTVVAVRMFR
ncbi:MAG: serine/threonine-protein phosphatase [Gammaproteobacteria bacterium]|nr:serine/threonine-protein phosphatase [Gammaproteobacteria bacterium]